MRYLLLLVFGVLQFSCSQKPDTLPISENDFCENIHRNDTVSLSKELAPLEELMSQKTGVFVQLELHFVC